MAVRRGNEYLGDDIGNLMGSGNSGDNLSNYFDRGQDGSTAGFSIRDAGIASVVGIAQVIRDLYNVDHAIAGAIAMAIPRVCNKLRDKIKAAIGTYLPGMPPLAEFTIYKHKREGTAGTGDTPLLFQGDLRESIEVADDRLDVSGTDQSVAMNIYSEDEHLKMNMHGWSYETRQGTKYVPARDPVTPTIEENRDEIIDDVSEIVEGAIDRVLARRAGDILNKSVKIVDGG